MTESATPRHGFDAVFYDLDGTLADSCDGIEWAAREALAQLWPQLAGVPLRHLIGPPIRIIFAAALREHGISEPSAGEWDALEANYRRLYDSEGCQIAQLFPGVRDGVQQCHEAGLRQFVVTNKPKLPTNRMLNALELLPFIEQTVSPDNREPRFGSKSEAAQWLIEQTNLDSSRVILLGDARDDALAAQAIGARFMAAAWGYGGARTLTDVPIWKSLESFSALQALL